MKIEEIKSISAQECEARLAEIKTEMNAEGADIEALSAEVDAIEERRKALAQAEEQRKALAQRIATGATATAIIEGRKGNPEMKNAEIRNTKEYINAFANYIKTGDDAECRALLTENVNGSVPVPELVDEYVATAWDREGIMRRVKKTYLKGNVKFGFEISGDDAVIHTEGSGAVDPEDLVHGIVTLIPANIKKIVEISDEALAMGGEAFLRYVYDEVTYKIAKKMADTLINLIVTAPTTSSSTQVSVSAIDVSAITIGTIAEALGELSDEASDPIVVINKKTWSAFKAVQYAGQFSVDPFEGLDVEYNNSLKSFAEAGDGDTFAIVGDFGNGARANFPEGEGIKFKFDELTKADKDLARIIGREYVALGLVAPKSFVRLVKEV